jgi:protein SCO1
MHALLPSLVLLLTLSLLPACQRSSTPDAAAAAEAANAEQFTVRGIVRKIDADGTRVTIKHEEIPNYMPAMTMPFNVRDPREIKDLQPGDAVTFRMLVTEDESWIDQVRKTGAAEEQSPTAERPTVRLVRDVEPLEVGDLVPNYQFTNELGKTIELANFRGKALALTFIFTRCPIPDFCPLMSKRFAEAYTLLHETPDAPTNWHLLSVSFDPHYDTPKVLQNYARNYNYDPNKWSFITGAMIDIDAITEQFDLPIFKQGEAWDHKLRTVVIDAAGRVHKVFVYNQWTARELADAIAQAARVPARPEEAAEPAAPQVSRLE